MIPLHRLLLIENPCESDVVLARSLSASVIDMDRPMGLPSHMWFDAKMCAFNYLREGEWFNHLYVCLFLVQQRTGQMDSAQIEARQDLERMLMDALFGR